jgi:cell division protein FtsB
MFHKIMRPSNLFLMLLGVLLAYSFALASGASALAAGTWLSGVLFILFLGWVYTYAMGPRVAADAEEVRGEEVQKLRQFVQEDETKIHTQEIQISQLKSEEEALEAKVQALKKQVEEFTQNNHSSMA